MFVGNVPHVPARDPKTIAKRCVGLRSDRRRVGTGIIYYRPVCKVIRVESLPFTLHHHSRCMLGVLQASQLQLGRRAATTWIKECIPMGKGGGGGGGGGLGEKILNLATGCWASVQQLDPGISSSTVRPQTLGQTSWEGSEREREKERWREKERKIGVRFSSD